MSHRVAIVGAGPAGAATALLLARNGVEVVLVERESDSARVFRGEGLMPTGLDALHQMGLGPGLARVPSRPLECWDIYIDGTRAMHIDEPSMALGDRALQVVSQPALLDLLLEEGGRHPGFQFRPGVSVRDVLRDDAGVRGLRASSPSGEFQIEADLVIGADGRASTVRKRSGLPLDRLPESYDVLWLKVPVPQELEGTCPIAIFASGPGALLTYVSWDGRWQVAWMLPKGAWRDVRQRDWLGECAALLPASLADHLLACRDRLEGPSLLDVVVGRCPRWSRPGVLLLGDAAHPMSPVRAQGINMALRDAIVAANHLVPALRGDGPLEDALKAVQAEREPEILRIQALQLREVQGQRWARAQPWLVKPMLKLAPLLARTGLVQRSWLRQQRPFRAGVTDVTLRV